MQTSVNPSNRSLRGACACWTALSGELAGGRAGGRAGPSAPGAPPCPAHLVAVLLAHHHVIARVLAPAAEEASAVEAPHAHVHTELTQQQARSRAHLTRATAFILLDHAAPQLLPCLMQGALPCRRSCWPGAAGSFAFRQLVPRWSQDPINIHRTSPGMPGCPPMAAPATCLCTSAATPGLALQPAPALLFTCCLCSLDVEGSAETPKHSRSEAHLAAPAPPRSPLCPWAAQRRPRTPAVSRDQSAFRQLQRLQHGDRSSHGGRRW